MFNLIRLSMLETSTRFYDIFSAVGPLWVPARISETSTVDHTDDTPHARFTILKIIQLHSSTRACEAAYDK